MPKKHYPRPATKHRRNATGEHLTNRRLQLNMTQMDVAKVLDVHPGRVSEWEQGLRTPPNGVLAEWLAFLQ